MASDAHEDPAFQAMCREHEIEGTAMVALCGAFWNRALASHTGEAEPVAYYNASWTLTPRAHAEAKKRDPARFIDMKPAHASPPVATPVAPGEVTDALKQWAWHWFGPEADEEWIAKALANLPPAALHPLLGVDQRGLEVAASFVQLHAPDSPLYDHLRSIAARIRPAALSSPAPVAAPEKSLLRAPLKPGEKLVCYCPPGICQAPKGFSGPCNRAAPAPASEAVALILLSSGEYSDYGVMGAFRPCKSFNVGEALDAFRAQWKPEANSYSSAPGPQDFAAWLAKEGYVEDANTEEIHLGSYGDIDPSDQSKALTFTCPPAGDSAEAPVQQAGVRAGYVVVPKRLTRAMQDILDEEGWQWGDLLSAAEVIREEEEEAIRRFESLDMLEQAEREAAEYQGLDAARDVLAERQRQISAEGWTPEHDDEHDDGRMAIAAAYYAMHGIKGWGRVIWPWDKKWLKPKDRRSNLIRASALILAEIERIDRAALKGEQPVEPSGSERGEVA
jgi:hypothetical protein